MAMTDRTGRLDLDDDFIIENSQVDALVNLDPGDTFSQHPIQSSDIDTDQITASELLLSITPTWTGEHAFNGGLRVEQGFGLLGLPNHHVGYTDSLSNEEIARFDLASGEELEVWRLDLRLKGGGTDSNVSIDVRDVSGGTTLASTTAGSRSTGGSSPLGTSSAGATIIVRLSTGSSAVDVCATGVTCVVSN